MAILEAIVYVTDEPLTAEQIADALGAARRDVGRRFWTDWSPSSTGPSHGLTIREVAGGYKMSTKPEHHEAIRAFVKKLKPPLKLSLAALETLAVIAYKQPITAPEIMEIRGVQGAGVLKTLLDRKLIATAGRKNVVGKPILYKTTKEFLVQFGLKDLSELPTLKEFEELRPHGVRRGDARAAADAGAGSRARSAAPAAGACRKPPSECLKSASRRSWRAPAWPAAARPRADPRRPRHGQRRPWSTDWAARPTSTATTSRWTASCSRAPQQLVYLALNKPDSVVTTVSDPQGRRTVMDLLQGVKERVYPVGRLDYHSEGLLLLTNDGEFAKRITSASSHVPKTYLVKVERDAYPGTGTAIPGRRPAAWPRTAPAGLRLMRRADKPVVRSAADRGAAEPGPAHVQAFRPAGGEAAARQDRFPGTGLAASPGSCAT